jgi:hypothetical protein
MKARQVLPPLSGTRRRAMASCNVRGHAPHALPRATKPAVSRALRTAVACRRALALALSPVRRPCRPFGPHVTRPARQTPPARPIAGHGSRTRTRQGQRHRAHAGTATVTRSNGCTRAKTSCARSRNVGRSDAPRLRGARPGQGNTRRPGYEWGWLRCASHQARSPAGRRRATSPCAVAHRVSPALCFCISKTPGERVTSLCCSQRPHRAPLTAPCRSPRDRVPAPVSW